MLGGGESLSADDYAFTRRNIANIDAKVYLGAEGHHHNGASAPISNPTLPPSVQLIAGSGNIPGGRTVRYKYTWVDQYGQETAASPERTITTPAPVATPGGPILQLVSGGSLLPGSYFYVLTAYKDANTLETLPGARGYTSILSSSTAKSIEVTFPTLPAGATGFNIYRRSPGSLRFQWLTNIDLDVATPPTNFLDDGTLTEDCNRTVPQRNTTANENSVYITIPGATPTVPDGYTWRLYRTFTLNDWGSSLLHWVVEETSESSGIIVTSYTDVGQSTSGSKYPDHSELAGSPSKILLTNGSEIQGFMPPGKNVIPECVYFSFPGPVEPATGIDQWISPYEKADLVSVIAYLGRDSVPASQSVIVDILRYSGSWESLFIDTADRPTIFPENNVSSEFIFTSSNVTTLSLNKGFRLSADVIQSGGGATPTDYNLVVCIKLLVKDGSETVSHTWTI